MSITVNRLIGIVFPLHYKVKLFRTGSKLTPETHSAISAVPVLCVSLYYVGLYRQRYSAHSYWLRTTTMMSTWLGGKKIRIFVHLTILPIAQWYFTWRLVFIICLYEKLQSNLFRQTKLTVVNYYLFITFDSYYSELKKPFASIYSISYVVYLHWCYLLFQIEPEKNLTRKNTS